MPYDAQMRTTDQQISIRILIIAFVVRCLGIFSQKSLFYKAKPLIS